MTSYTDEQVQELARVYGRNVASMLRSLLADRTRLQAEVDSHAARLMWASHAWGGQRHDYSSHVLRRGGDGDLSDVCMFIDAARAKRGDV